VEGVEIMTKRVMLSLTIPRYAFGILVGVLVISVGMNFYLFFGRVKPFDEGHDKEATPGWVDTHFGGMWNDFSVGLTPNRAVLSLEGDREFSVTIKGSYWAPFDFGSRPFYFNIYDIKTDYRGSLDADPKLLDEETVLAEKSKNELNYVIPASNFTIFLDAGGTDLYIIVGAAWPDVTLSHWDCIATFALNVV
jgi:hypothetical protein